VILAIALPNLTHARESARIEQARADLEIIAASVQQLAWDTGRWPGGLVRNLSHSAELWDLRAAASGLRTGSPSLFPDWKGPYIHKVPEDPWGSPYFFDPDYRVTGVMRVVVGSFGPNKAGRNLYDSDDVFVTLD
jgi:type II secretory pathway pseudopilin PulG